MSAQSLTPTLTQRLTANPEAIAKLTLSLTAEERTRSRRQFEASNGQPVYLHLPRGTVLHNGDLLQAENDGLLVRVIAKPEPVLTVRADTPLDLLQAAYHLGNRHVPLEITSTYLRFSPDPVLQKMLEHRRLHIIAEIQPFQPEMGAYGHSH